MPQKPLEPFELLNHVLPSFDIMAPHPLEILMQHCNSHGDVEPSLQVLDLKIQVQLQPPHGIPSIREKCYRLIHLHPLRLEQLKQPPSELFIVGLHDPQHLCSPAIEMLLPTISSKD